VNEHEVKRLLAGEPFVPFRIKLDNGNGHDIPYAHLVAELERGLFIAQQGGHWVQFPYERISSLESLVAVPE
jgi:hypothetical protein